MNQYHLLFFAIFLYLGVTDIRTTAEPKNAGKMFGVQSKHVKDLKGCPPEFTLLGNICYYFQSQITTWYDALQACHDRGTHLAYPLNVNENVLLKNYLRNTYGPVPDSWWMGGTDSAMEGNWVWTHSMDRINYTDWCHDEPNNIGGENCLSFNTTCDFYWNDRGCSYNQFGYICQP